MTREEIKAMARPPISTTKTPELAIVWHPSRRDNVRTFVENWFAEYFMHSDDTLSGETQSLVYQLILDDVCTKQHEDRVTYTQIIAALEKERRIVNVGIDEMTDQVCDVLREQRKQFERAQFDKPVPRLPAPSRIVWSSMSA
jgi:hypothetical protein